ncbi:MAG: antibiotic biosynthesis monooxygenase [Flavitalea sp.]
MSITPSPVEQIVNLFVRVITKNGHEPQGKKALMDDVIGARTEAGNLKMELYQSAISSSEFYLIERWSDGSQLDEHFKQPYTQGAFDLQKEDLREPIEMNYMQEHWQPAGILNKESHQSYKTLIVPFEVKEGCGESFIKEFEKFVPIVRKEEGNIEFHFFSVIGSNNRFVLYERWESHEHLEAHNKQSTTIDFVSRITPLLTKEVSAFILHVTDIS